ncbi:MAG TPA: discoidin domain-containing protein, partial [Thermoanaerobaculia bacterium]|nr:discoidin domain-containing protein [Thermoanaerobaculia bacterium]
APTTAGDIPSLVGAAPRGRPPGLLLVVLAVAFLAPAISAQTLDSFDDATRWQVLPSDGVAAAIAVEDGSLRLDFDFQGHAGYVVLRRTLTLDLPGNYVLRLALRGEAPANNLELKLIDPSLENVWWMNRRAFRPPRERTVLTTRKRDVTFAWGPAGGGELSRVAAIEIAVSAAEGGRGSLWFDALELEARPPDTPWRGTPRATASAEEPGGAAGLALDGDPATAWRAPGGGAVWQVDFEAPREMGGLALDWDPASRPRAYRLERSLDGKTWEPVAAPTRAGGATDWLSTPDAEARYLRLTVGSGEPGAALCEVRVLPLAVGASANDLFSAIAFEAERGDFPRGFLGEAAFWTVLGRDGDADEALLNEDGALEIGRGAFSIEPFLLADGRLLSWAQARPRVGLAEGDLPLPFVHLAFAPGWRLEVDALVPVTGFRGAFARYRLVNEGPVPRRARLVLAARPFQVNPPWQFLNQPGGMASLGRVVVEGPRLRVDDRPPLRFTPAPAAGGALAFEEGPLASLLRSGGFPERQEAVDERGWASAALAWDLELRAGEAKSVLLAVPFSAAGAGREATEESFEAARREAAAWWRERVGAVRFELPAPVAELAPLARTVLAHVLINRDGRAIQPGSRSYERSWIRDGALTSSALLRFGVTDAARDFLAWFAPFQFPTGKVPCCVDRRGADPVPEHDSPGELLFLAAEVLRYSGDRALVERLWPQVEATVAYLDSLRQQRRTEEYRQPEKRAFFGLLPESISHEGYSAKPMHSYWDDFWALRGLRDAVYLAEALGHAERARQWAAMRDEFAADLHASLRRVIAERGLDTLPASVELADFDPASSALALYPGGELPRLPEGPTRRTFERYFEEVSARWQGKRSWDAYTPYELRLVGTLVRLGEREKAAQLLAWLVADRRPPAWNQWPEVTFKDARAPRFLGDLPHTWVGSEYLRSLADVFAYEGEPGELVLADGIPLSWLAAGPVGVQGLRTPWGPLDLRVTREGDTVRVRVGEGLTVPPGCRLRLRSPFPGGEDVTVAALPAEVVFRWGRGGSGPARD